MTNTSKSVTPLEIREVDYFEKDVKFASLNKNDNADDYYTQVDQGRCYTQEVHVSELIILSKADFKEFKRSLLTDREWLKGKGGTNSKAELREVNNYLEYTEEEREVWKKHSYTECVLVTSETYKNFLFVDPQGYGYARYVGIAFGYDVLLNLEKAAETTKELTNYEQDETHENDVIDVTNEEPVAIPQDDDVIEVTFDKPLSEIELAIKAIKKAVGKCTTPEAKELLTDSLSLVEKALEVEQMPTSWEVELEDGETVDIEAEILPTVYEELERLGHNLAEVISIIRVEKTAPL